MTNAEETDSYHIDTMRRGTCRRIRSLANQLCYLLSGCDLSQERNGADARGLVILCFTWFGKGNIGFYSQHI